MYYPNQKIIRINKFPLLDKAQVVFRNVVAERAAAKDLHHSTMMLWLYLVQQENRNELPLSPVEVELAIGLPKTTYPKCIKELEQKGYLVPSEGCYYNFYEMPEMVGLNLQFETIPKKESLIQRPISISNGQNCVRDLLFINNVPFQQEYSITKDNETFRFDFTVFNEYGIAYFIEYDGEQHFKPLSYLGGQPALEERQTKDKRKNQLAKEMNLPIIRIPYTAKDSLSLLDLLPSTSSFLVN